MELELTGAAYSDRLYGGAGSDTLNAGGGNDYLAGCKDYDTYIFNGAYGKDTIQDSDGQGQIQIDGQALTGGSALGSRVYLSLDKKHTYALLTDDATDTTLVINASIIVKNFNKSRGDFGLSFTDAPVASNPSTGKDIKGDLKPTNFGTDTNPRYETDPQTGNIIVGSTVEANRIDILYDSAGNDHITSGGGDDDVYLTKGGDNWVETGSGRDWVRGGSGKDLIEGGADGDILLGGAGADRLFAASQITVAQAIENGNSQVGTGLQGDFLTGGAGDDVEVGSNANDAIYGGGGNDLLIGGAGHDRVFGDQDLVADSRKTAKNGSHSVEGSCKHASDNKKNTPNSGAACARIDWSIGRFVSKNCLKNQLCSRFVPPPGINRATTQSCASSNKSDALTCMAWAMRTALRSVKFFSPRSTAPMYVRCSPDSNDNVSCDHAKRKRYSRTAKPRRFSGASRLSTPVFEVSACYKSTVY